MAAKSKIAMVAGSVSHGSSAHEHVGGCLLLADLLNEHVDGAEAVVHRGWPEAPDAFEDVAAIAIYSDGGAGHLIIPHLDRVADLMKNEFNMETELIKGGGGIFDVKLDGKLIYSKNQTGLFPTDEDIRKILKK